MDYEIEKLRVEHLSSVAHLHVDTFHGYFLSRMGERFLREYYRCYLFSDHAIGYAALTCGNKRKVVGFVTGTDNSPSFYEQAFHQRFWALAYTAAIRCIFKPSIISEVWSRRSRVLKNNNSMEPTNKSDGSLSQDLPIASLISIGVDPQYRRQGIAKKLTLAFLEELRKRDVSLVKLSVLQENVAAREFYEHMGWKQNDSGQSVYKGISLTYTLSL